MEEYMLPIKTLKIYINNYSEIPYQTLKKNNYHKLYQKNTCNKINALHRIRKLNTRGLRGETIHTMSYEQVVYYEL